MSIRRFVATMFAFLLPGAMPALGAAGISSSVALTITTPGMINFGQSVDGYANVTTSDNSLPSGTITFFDGVQSICTISVTQAASCPASTGTGFAVGTHVLTAVYSGDALHLGSTSNAVTVMVLPDGTAVSLTSSANPATEGQSVVFTAAVTGFQGMPSGVVTFFDGGVALGTAVLGSAGVATFSTASLSAGSHNVTASYAGDTNSSASASAALTETVSGPVAGGQEGFSVTVTGSTTVNVGRIADLVVTVVPQQGFAQPVELSCADLPTEAACTFGMRTIPAGGGATTLQVSTIAPHDCGSTTPYFASLAGPMMAGMVLLFVPRKRRLKLKGLLIALVAVCGMAALTGCGNCTDLGTRPGSYTIRVIGTAAGSVVTSRIRMKVVVR